MHLSNLKLLMLRDLDTLEREIRAYPDTAAVWQAAPGIPNVAGTLTLHLCGNLRHFIGAVLGDTGYVRERDTEFALRDVPREDLLAGVAATRTEVAAALDGLDASVLDEPYPLEIGGGSLSTGLFLAHLATHLALHLGQIDYHRRMVTGEARGVGVVGIPKPQAAATSGPGP
jgi:hypothetical protein